MNENKRINNTECVGAKAQYEKNALKHYKKRQTNNGRNFH